MSDTNLKLAGKGTRLLNVIVDMAAIFIIWFILAFLLGVIVLAMTDRTQVPVDDERLLFAVSVFLLPVFWLYYIFLEYKFQRTLGKLITRTRVTTEKGDKPLLKQILIRTLCRSIPLEYISYLITAEGLHDTLSETRVIKVRGQAIAARNNTV